MDKERPSTEDLKALHQWCNEKYWDGLLPSDIPVEWNTRLLKTTGRMIRKYRGNEPYKIELSDSIRGDSESIINVLVHEQIHLWQHHMADQKNDLSYRDIEREPGHPYKNRGHGRYFYHHMNRLNRDFPELKITVVDDAVVNLDQPSNEVFHGLKIDIAYNGRTESAIFYGEGDFSKRGKDLVPQIEGIFGRKRLKSVTPFVTMNATIKKMEKLTKSLNFRKNQRGFVHNKKHVDVIMNDSTTTPLTPFSLESSKLSKNVPDDVVDTKVKLKKHQFWSLDHYMRLYANNTGSMQDKGLDEVEGYRLVAGNVEGLSKEVSEFIVDSWKEAKPSDMMRSNPVKGAINQFILALSKEIPPEETQRSLDKAWLYAGPARIGRKAFSKALESHVVSHIKRQTKRDASRLVREVMESIDTADKKLSLDEVVDLAPKFSDDSKETFRLKAISLMKISGIPFSHQTNAMIDNLWRNPTEKAILESTSGKMAKSFFEKAYVTENPNFFRDFTDRFKSFSGRVSSRDFVDLMSRNAKVRVDEDFKQKAIKALGEEPKAPMQKKVLEKTDQLDMIGF